MKMIGKFVSHYQILEKLGQGGMGVVYKAEDSRLKRPVALKFLPPDLTRDQEANERFVYEAQTASALDHQNVCTIHEIDKHDDGSLFICMGYYEGETLYQRIARGLLPVDEAMAIAIQIACGLAKAHAEGIIHRDIKPGNIIVQEDGTVKIIDFGLSKLIGAQGITRGNSTLGTVAYMSPEQARGDKVDHQTDIWSLGAVLYEMLTGEQPFQGELDQAVIYTILNTEPTSMHELPGEIPEPLSMIVGKALKKEPTERYQNIGELLDDLYKLKEGLKTNGELKLPKKDIKKKHPVKKQIAVACVFLLVLLAIFLKLGLERSEEDSPKKIAIVGFENQTGDESLDYLQKAIPSLLIINLEKSGELDITTWERMRDILKQMHHEDVDIIKPELGFELCKRKGIETIILGSFTKAGNVFVIESKVLDVATKRLIKGASSKGVGIASILERQIDAISKEIMNGLGLSTQKTERIQYKIIGETTSSIEAYKNYILGLGEIGKRDYPEAAKYYLKAVEMDTTFALAYHGLAYTLDIGTKEGREALEKAMKYAGRATESERLMIEATYARRIEFDVEQWASITKQIVQKYPNNPEGPYMLARYYGYRYKGLAEKAIPNYKRALDVYPNFVRAMWRLAQEYTFAGEYSLALEYLNKYAEVMPDAADPVNQIAEVYFRMGRLDAAIEKYQDAYTMDHDYNLPLFWYCNALKENYEEAMKWADKPVFHVRRKYDGYFWKSFYQAWLGDSEQALSTLRILEEKGGSRLWINRLKAWIYSDRGELKLSRKYIERSYQYRDERKIHESEANTAFYNFQMGMLDLSEGNIDSAEFRLDEIKKLLPQFYGLTQNSVEYHFHFLHSEILLAKSNTKDAIINIKNTPSLYIPPCPDYFTTPLHYNLPFLKDQLARAYYQNGQIDKAVAEYEHLIMFDPKNKDRYLIHPKYYYRLGKLYEEKGDNSQAIVSYERFLELWRDADKSLPQLKDVKFRLNHLKETIHK